VTLAEGSEVPRGGGQRRGEPFRTDVIQAFPDHRHHGTDLRVVRSPPLPVARTTLQGRGGEQADEAFAMEPCHCRHFRQQRTPPRPIRRLIPGLYLLEILAPLINRHLVVSRHRPLLGNIVK
jgi:hypothetical protein